MGAALGRWYKWGLAPGCIRLFLTLCLTLIPLLTLMVKLREAALPTQT